VINECFVEDFGGTVHDESGRSYWPDADTTVRANSPTGPSPSSATRRGSNRYPHPSGPATSSSRPCGMPRSRPTGRSTRPAPTAPA
jgi:hypothetical protein